MVEITDAICSFCGSLCDDLTVKVEDNRIVDVRRACRLGAKKILGHERIPAPMIRDGSGELVEASYDEAIDRAAEILAGSKRPLLYGWASTSCEAQSKGILLAEIIGGVIDNTASVCHGPSTLAVQEKGLPTASLGQMKNRADLVIFWGCNPVHAHPRHMSRYSVYKKGFFLDRGRQNRKFVTVDVRMTDTAAISDEFIQIEQGSDYLIVSAIRALVNGKGDVVPETVAGVPKEELARVAEMMTSCRFGMILYGMGLTQSRSKYKNIDIALSLINDLNTKTKFVITPMRGHYNVTGFGQVCSWQTGFPTVDLARGVPYYNPGEMSANDLLMRDEVDSAMIIAGDAGAHFPAASIRNLAKVPLVQIDPYPNATTELANVVIPAAIVGIECEGTAYRMDGVSLRMRKLVESDYLSDEEILDRIIEKVRVIKGE
ncbi:formylmethanofuran dehydrogenase subunit B [Candidatus Methanoperedenaceae archaeon GB50]|uniref:Formylmethanofuran dehydrogenase subunit B n=1 Tax=Candidatus Methanoperedenaceae archaeon GB50 TaxID=2691038 RepID=A0ACD6B9F8_9EURY|nr:formylmethanofuran dehydrogenase subunit B [Candidatus Methanoperedenaceae archaeon GB50]